MIFKVKHYVLFLTKIVLFLIQKLISISFFAMFVNDFYAFWTESIVKPN